jgi:serine/threonine protein kinase
LTLPERELDPLFNKQLILEPFYKEAKIEMALTPKQSQVTLKDFHFIKCVGLGGFSRVYLVQKKDTGKMYALKLIEKKFIQTNKKEVIV